MFAAAAAKSLQSCPTLCDPIDGSPAGSPVPGIIQARTLEWVAISFSSAWKWKVKVKSLSRARLLATPWTAATRLLCPRDSPGLENRNCWNCKRSGSSQKRETLELLLLIWYVFKLLSRIECYSPTWMTVSAKLHVAWNWWSVGHSSAPMHTLLLIFGLIRKPNYGGYLNINIYSKVHKFNEWKAMSSKPFLLLLSYGVSLSFFLYKLEIMYSCT